MSHTFEDFSFLQIFYYLRGGVLSCCEQENTTSCKRITCKRLLAVLLFFFFSLIFSLTCVFATPSKIIFRSQDPLAKYFRYQLNGEDEDKWTVIDINETNIVLSSKVGKNTIYVQSSRSGNTWSKSGIGTYRISNTALRLNLDPYSSAVYYFYNGHYIDEARTLMGTIYGLSLSLEFDWALNNLIRVYPEAGYAMVLKIQTIIPKQRAVQYIKLGGGVDFLFNITTKSDAYVGLLGGGMAHINNSEYTITPYFGTRFGFETKITDNIKLGIMMRVSCALLKTSEVLTDSLTFLVDPISISLSYEL